MTGRSPNEAPAGRLPELDGLRAIAVLLVLAAHCLVLQPIDWLNRVGERGWIGVDLFFVLSGFLIGGILFDHRSAPNYYRVFYWRRFLRIVPLYAVLVLPGLVLLTFGLQRFLGGHAIVAQSAGGAWLCVFFVQNFSAFLPWKLPPYLVPTWSVAVEEQFYLLLPPLVRNLDTKRLLKILVVAIALAPVMRGLVFCFAGENAGRGAYSALPCRWDGLLMGVLCAMAFRDPAFRSWIAQRMAAARTVWLLCTVIAVGWLAFTHDRFDPWLQIPGYSVVDLCFATTLLLAVLSPAGALHRALSWPGFRPIAVISYALYLLHSPMLGVVESAFRYAHITCERNSWTEFGMAMISLAATVVVSALSWRFFESRMIRLGHRHRYDASPGD